MRYNHGVNRSVLAVLLAGLAILAGLVAWHKPVHASQPTGYDLAAVVNAYREANGYYALNPHPLVMAAAQAHADWIVQTGQGGHIGAGGSDETVRVSWTGYGGGASIQCDENWGGGRTIEEVMSGSWSDWVHQEVMLNAWGNRYTDIGGGVASRENGRYVFVLNVCKVIGQEASGQVPLTSPPLPGVPANPQSAPDRSNIVIGVTRATPQADGAIIHTVRYGQSLAAIADAYGVRIEDLQALNDMGAEETLIWPDQELLIQRGSGAQPAAPTATAGIPDATPSVPPSATATPVAATITPIPMTPTSQAPAGAGGAGSLVGILLLGLAGVVLVLFLWLSPLKE